MGAILADLADPRDAAVPASGAVLCPDGAGRDALTELEEAGPLLPPNLRDLLHAEAVLVGMLLTGRGRFYRAWAAAGPQDPAREMHHPLMGRMAEALVAHYRALFPHMDGDMNPIGDEAGVIDLTDSEDALMIAGLWGEVTLETDVTGDGLPYTVNIDGRYVRDLVRLAHEWEEDPGAAAFLAECAGASVGEGG